MPLGGGAAGGAAAGGGGMQAPQEPAPAQSAALEAPQGEVENVQPGLESLPDSLKSLPADIKSLANAQEQAAEAAEAENSGQENSDVMTTLRSTARNATATTPLSGIVPAPLLPVVALTTGMAIGLGANLFWANFDRIFSSKWFHFIRDFLGENTLQRLDEYEAKKRKLTVGAAKRTRIGLTHMEIAVAVAGAVLIGVATLVALHENFAVDTVFLYVLTGGVAITVHEMGHRFAAHHHKVLTEVKFWEIGTIVMFFTGWFAGNVFAQPHRTVVEEKEDEDHHIDAKISLAGPVTSICFGILVVPFLFVGGDVTKIASTLLMMTLLVALYHLMPFGPMDGKAVYRWSKVVLLATLVPLFIIYYYLFLL